MTLIIIATVSMLAVGCGVGFLSYRLMRNQILRKAQNEAQEILQEAKDLVEIRQLEEKEILQDIETQLWTRAEPELLKVEERLEELQDLADEKKQKIDQMYGTERRNLVERENQVKHEEESLRKIDEKYKQRKNHLQDTLREFVERLSKHSGIPLQDALSKPATPTISSPSSTITSHPQVS